MGRAGYVGKGSRYGSRQFGQGKIRMKRKRKNIIVVGMKEKYVENVLLSILRISGP